MASRASRILRVIVIVLLALGTALFLYLLINNFQFTRGRSIRVHFSSVGDLNAGAWVRKSGLKVGSVTRIEPAEDEKTIIVTLTFRPGQIVRTTDKFALVSKGILGDVYVEQNPGPKDSPMATEGMLFEGTAAFNLGDLIGPDVLTMIGQLVDSVKGFVDLLQQNSGTIASALKDLAKTSENLRVVSDRAVAATADLPTMANQIADSIAQLQKTVDELSSAAHRVSVSLEGNITSSSDDLSASMKSIRQASDQINQTVSQLTAQQSVLSKLSAPSTSQSLDVTLRNLQDISTNLLTVTKQAQTILQGVQDIFTSSH
ncbi:MAG TPA: MlaD family protein [Spirochaetia bacterium]|nr:MlaD family protein [Spirochaetia bacterium]